MDNSSMYAMYKCQGKIYELQPHGAIKLAFTNISDLIAKFSFQTLLCLGRLSHYEFFRELLAAIKLLPSSVY